jgi:hypothetical protein
MRFIVLFLAFIALPVAAQESGFYMGGGIGGYEIDDFEAGIDPDFGVDGFDPQISGTSFGIYGGWQFIPYVGAELSWTRLRKEDDRNTVIVDDEPEELRLELETDVLALTINPTLPLGENFALFGKIGWAWYQGDAKLSSGPFSVTDDPDDDDATYGLGGEYRFDRYAVRAEANMLDMSEADAWSYLFSVRYSL